MNKIVIIGGGASGLVSAICLARRGYKVTILEKNNICGKKLLKTGNGRCNYFNENQNIENYNSQNVELVKQVITKEKIEKVVKFFADLGMQNALLTEIKNLDIEVKNNINVKDIKLENEAFLIKAETENIYCKKLILATGSKADPKTGSDGIGYQICKKLGHTIIKPLPALVRFKSK